MRDKDVRPPGKTAHEEQGPRREKVPASNVLLSAGTADKTPGQDWEINKT